MFWGGAVLLLGIWRTGENTNEQGNNRELGDIWALVSGRFDTQHSTPHPTLFGCPTTNWLDFMLTVFLERGFFPAILRMSWVFPRLFFLIRQLGVRVFPDGGDFFRPLSKVSHSIC